MKLNAAQRKQLIEKRLQSLKPLSLTVIDESDEHLGHHGAQTGASHFALTIVCEQFENLSLIKRHQLIYQLLDDLIPHEIHALKIKAVSLIEASQ